MTKKISPTNPDTKTPAKTDDKATPTAERKTSAFKWRKMGRKTAAFKIV